MSRRPLPRTLRARLNPPRPVSWCRRVERLLRWDPNGRGLVSDRDLGILSHVRGDLQRATRVLARPAGCALVVTGFPVVGPGGACPETDGPPGAVLLASALAEIGWQAVVVTDSLSAEVVRRCVEEVRGRGAAVRWSVVDEPGVDASAATAVLECVVDGRTIGALIAVERPGPAHSPATARLNGEPDPVFETVVPAEHWGQYHSCRGTCITSHCAGLHAWFELDLPVGCRIGVGDGGNEIGMGRIPWRLLHVAVRDGVGGLIACRTPADSLVIAGVSNWGAYALAVAAGVSARCARATRWITSDWERRLVEACLDAGAVDGISGQPVPQVDGQPLELHADLITALRRAVRLPE